MPHPHLSDVGFLDMNLNLMHAGLGTSGKDWNNQPMSKYCLQISK
jgi:hypothetical protein